MPEHYLLHFILECTLFVCMLQISYTAVTGRRCTLLRVEYSKCIDLSKATIKFSISHNSRGLTLKAITRPTPYRNQINVILTKCMHHTDIPADCSTYFHDQ